MSREMIDAFGILFWPLIALGSLTGLYVFNHRGLPLRNTLAWIALALIVFPVFALVMFFLNRSMLIRLDQDIFFMVIGTIFLGCLAVASSSRTQAWSFLVLGVASIGFGAWNLIGDLFLSHQTVDGFVQRTTNETPRALTLSDPKFVAVLVVLMVLLGILVFKTIRDPRRLKFNTIVIAGVFGALGFAFLYRWMRFGL